MLKAIFKFIFGIPRIIGLTLFFMVFQGIAMALLLGPLAAIVYKMDNTVTVAQIVYYAMLLNGIVGVVIVVIAAVRKSWFAVAGTIAATIIFTLIMLHPYQFLMVMQVVSIFVHDKVLAVLQFFDG